MDSQRYTSPLSSRYAGSEMQYLFSEEFKFRTWRRLWISLARAEKKLGLDITEEQIEELEMFKDDINYDVAREREKEVRHDVMSHVYAYGRQCPKAEPIIHLGATSCFVGDNTDLVILKKAAELIKTKLGAVILNLSEFADEYKSLPCLGYTHMQPAQLTTVGKRACLWINEFLMDAHDLDHRIGCIRFLGSKGATGTQASFMELFSGDENKIKILEKMISEDFGFNEYEPVSGQTYSRKVDYFFLSCLSGIAQSAYKFSNDMRLLQSFEEVEEPFEKNQIGSSAMPYKRNPMRCERISALARFVISLTQNPAFTASTQWFERTLDDSANKRLAVSEAFLAADSILNIMINVTSGLVVYPKVIEKRVMEKLPFMATENILMEAVKSGGNRQELHEKLRVYSHEAAGRVKREGLENNLLEKIMNDNDFGLDSGKLGEILDPALYTGRSSSQVDDFIKDYVNPYLEKNNVKKETAELRV